MTPDLHGRRARVTPDLMRAGAARAAPRRSATSRRPRRPAFGRARASPGELDIAHGAILYLDDITVSFDGFKALNALSLSISAGELRCIIGPNGAGKTTMMDVITGKTRPDAGKVFFGSTIDLLRLRENEIAQIGIGRKFQKPTVFEQLTRVREPRARAQGRPRRARVAVLPPDAARSSTASARCSTLIHLKDSAQRTAGAAARTARSSGSRSACC